MTTANEIKSAEPAITETEDFAHTGPGTLAGRFMRRFWQPVYVSRELMAGDRFTVRIMSEDFLLFRGESGKAYLTESRCAHRGTELSSGWVEGDCIRCFYHGWKYEGSGQCVEQPAEGEGFARKIRLRSYPVEEYNGLVFAYLGEDTPPPLPRYPQFDSSEGVLDAGRGTLPYNYFNQVENSVDAVHVEFVHSSSGFSEGGLIGVPKVGAEETEYGMLLSSTRETGVSRIDHFQMPTILYIKVYPYDEESGWRDFLLWRVPIDDHSFHTFFFLMAHIRGKGAERYRSHEDRLLPFTHDSQIVEVGEALRHGKLRFEQIDDRRRMVSLQDYVAQLGQGVIADRRHERLGRSDVAIILLRKLWTQELQAVAEGKPRRPWAWSGDIEATTGV